MFFVFSSFLYRYTVLARESDAIGIRWYGLTGFIASLVRTGPGED